MQEPLMVVEPRPPAWAAGNSRTFNRLLGDRRSSVEPVNSNATGADQPKRLFREQTLRSPLSACRGTFVSARAKDARLGEQRGGAEETGLAAQFGGDHPQAGEKVETRVGT